MEQVEPGKEEKKKDEASAGKPGVESVASTLEESKEVLKQLKETSSDTIVANVTAEQGGKDAESVEASVGGQEVSAATIGRMLGLATNTEIKLLASKLDLLATKVNSMNARLEKVGTLLAKAPTGSDLDRIDVQIGALRTLIKEALISAFGDKSEGGDKGMKKATIMSNKE